LDHEAKIKLIAEGVRRAQNELNQLAESLGGLGKKAETSNSAMKELGRMAFRMASDVSRAFNDVKPIDFGASGDKARAFADSTARYAQKVGGDAGQIAESFKAAGVSIGVTAERVASFTKGLQASSLNDGAAGAVEQLGQYANSTGRELEEVAEVGSLFLGKLGMPVEKVGESLAKVRDIAKEFSTVGGTLALERSLVRLGPTLQAVSGSFSQQAALVAELGKGKSPDVADETAGSVLGTIQGLDALKFNKKMTQLTGDAEHQSIVPNANGRYGYKLEDLQLWQKHLRSIPRSAAYQPFGTSLQGIQAAETFIRADLSKLGKAGARSGLIVDSVGYGEKRRRERAQAEVERSNVELEVGEVVVDQQAERNKLYKNHRGAQAAVDTVKKYLPTKTEGAVDIAEAAVVHGLANYEDSFEARIAKQQSRRAKSAASSNAQVQATVEIGPASIANLAKAVSNRPVIAKPDKSSSAAAVEDSKARNRGGANH
jgi:hypothetical protein